MADYFFCPHCGAGVKTGAAACRECGSDEDTGWAENASFSDLTSDADPPFGSHRQGPGREFSGASFWSGRWIIVVAAVTLLGFLLPYMNRLAGLVFTALLLGGVLVYWFRHPRPSAQVLSPHDEAELLYFQLLHKAGGDPRLVERLLAYEREINPAADKVHHLQAALDRWQNDAR